MSIRQSIVWIAIGLTTVTASIITTVVMNTDATRTAQSKVTASESVNQEQEADPKQFSVAGVPQNHSLGTHRKVNLQPVLPPEDENLPNVVTYINGEADYSVLPNPYLFGILKTDAQNREITVHKHPDWNSADYGYGLPGDRVELRKYVNTGYNKWWLVHFPESNTTGWVRDTFVEPEL